MSNMSTTTTEEQNVLRKPLDNPSEGRFDFSVNLPLTMDGSWCMASCLNGCFFFRCVFTRVEEVLTREPNRHA